MHRRLVYICYMGGMTLLSFWQQLEHWDQWLFIQINSTGTNSFFDAVLPFFRNSAFWTPLYLFILAFIILNYGKKGAWWGLAFLCTIAISDIASSRIIKEIFERLRPCRDPAFYMHVRLLAPECAGGYSFTSSQAANLFAMATFVSITFYPVFKRWVYLSYLWAFVISYAQIYLGLHYPLDVLGGAGLGVLAGLLTAWVFNKNEGTLI